MSTDRLPQERRGARRQAHPMVVTVRAAGGPDVVAMSYRDDEGALPDDGQLARLRSHFESAFVELHGRLPASIDIETRAWEPSDGNELKGWRTALRVMDAKGNRS
jgi:hypothetical protein